MAMAAGAPAHPTQGPLSLDALARAMPTGLAVVDTQGQYQLGRHLEVLNQHLLDVAAGRIRRLIVTMPPQHGKSTLISRYFPAWYIGNYPTEHVNLVSYEATFARKHGAAARDILERNRKAFNVSIREDESAKNDWETPQGGGLFSTGIGGPLTGRPGNIIIDDPVKNQEEAVSPTIQERNIEWWRTVAKTRMRPHHWCVIVMTRWSLGDLVGQLLGSEDERDEWTVLNLPALATEATDPLGRKPGEALWPEVYDRAYLEKMRRQQRHWFAAMYQGNPVPDDGLIFRRSSFRYYRVEGDQYLLKQPDGTIRPVPREACSVVAFFDPAATEGELSAYCAITTWAVTPANDLLLLGMVREKAETTKHRALVDSVIAAYHPSVVGIEKGAYGFHALQSLGAKGYPVKPIRAEKDKVARARVAEARYDLGKVYHPEGTDWLGTFEAELLYFPRGRYKDLVDTTSMAAAWVSYGSDDPDPDDDGASLADVLNGVF